MAPLKPNKPTLPTRDIYDNWVSHSTGHQVADNPYSNTTAWRDTRAQKLGHQFKAGDCLTRNSERGQGSAPGAFDGTPGPDSPESGLGSGSGSRSEYWRDSAQARDSKPRPGGEYRWVSDAEAQRSQMGVRDIRSFMGVNKRKADDKVNWTEKKLKWVHPMHGAREKKVSLKSSSREGMSSSGDSDSSDSKAKPETIETPIHSNPPNLKAEEEIANAKPKPDPYSSSDSTTPDLNRRSRILAGTSIYINGSTLPHISDHKLRHLLAAHGAKVATFMARKSVTHVIVAQPGTIGAGAGGGLAARKLEMEISRGGWKGVTAVGVEWVLESIKAGKRLSESKFSVLNVAPKGQRSITGFFGGA